MAAELVDSSGQIVQPRNITHITNVPQTGRDWSLDLAKLNYSTIGDGRKVVTTAGTRVALAASTAIKTVVITAETDNTDKIVVGGSTVVAALATRQGTPLDPGDSLILNLDDLADVYIDSMVSGEGVTFTYLN